MMNILKSFVSRYEIVLCLFIISSLFSYNSCADEPKNNACAYACLDWTLGSAQMQQAEEAFKARTGQDVHFGVGTLMAEGDEVGTNKHLGRCFRLTFMDGQKDIIAQAVNTGYDMSNPNQFDIQMGAGGMGAFNACAGEANTSMYPGSKSVWGAIYGGIQNEEECSNLPPYPAVVSTNSSVNNLQLLCQYGFINKYRGADGQNFKFKYVPEEVKCPQELIQISGFSLKSGGPSGYEITHFVPCTIGDKDSIACAMTRMMDCAKPTAGWNENIKNLGLTGPIKVCQRDGYTSQENENAPSAASAQCQSGSPQSQSLYCKDHPDELVGFCSWDGGNSAGGDYCNAGKDRCLSCGGGSWCTCNNGQLKECSME